MKGVVTIGLDANNYRSTRLPERGDVMRIHNESSGNAEWHFVFKDDKKSDYAVEFSVTKINISKWWLIRKIQFMVLKYTFKR